MAYTILRLLRVVVGFTVFVILPTLGTLDQHVFPVVQRPIHSLHWVGILVAAALVASATPEIEPMWTRQDQ